MAMGNCAGIFLCTTHYSLTFSSESESTAEGDFYFILFYKKIPRLIELFLCLPFGVWRSCQLWTILVAFMNGHSSIRVLHLVPSWSRLHKLRSCNVNKCDVAAWQGRIDSEPTEFLVKLILFETKIERWNHDSRSQTEDRILDDNGNSTKLPVSYVAFRVLFWKRLQLCVGKMIGDEMKMRKVK